MNQVGASDYQPTPHELSVAENILSANGLKVPPNNIKGSLVYQLTTAKPEQIQGILENFFPVQGKDDSYDPRGVYSNGIPVNGRGPYSNSSNIH